jgi:alkylation response protein AidB-like acyl-CoA dehydrogenase
VILERRTVLDWSDEHKMLRDAIRTFVEKEIVPLHAELEHGDLAPYGVLRKLFATFGIDELARDGFKQRLARDAARRTSSPKVQPEAPAAGFDPALMLILLVELSRYCPGMVTALGVSAGLTASAIDGRGTLRQRARWVPELLALDRIGAWALTEPGAGSDAFGAMRAHARRDGNDYILNGSKTFITNGPYADTIVFICKLDEGNPTEKRNIVSFVIDRGMPGLEQSPPLRKMGMHSSPTGEIFVTDVRVGIDRLLGENEDASTDARAGAKGTFATERASVAAMALGIIDRCLSLCIDYANDRVQFGRPIGDFQLIQEKLASMEVARLNVSNLVFRYIEAISQDQPLSLAEASAMKLYSARAATDVAMEAVQLFGGNGYMVETGLEQLARDAKALQIYGGTDEVQITHIAKDLLGSRSPSR